MSEEEKIITVGDVMSITPVVIDGLASVYEALKLMEEKRLSSLVIDRRFDHDEYGMISVHDIAAKVVGPNRSTKRTSVYEIMTKPVLTIHRGMDIKYAIRHLTRFGLTRALVTEKGNMVGIVSLRDMTVRYVSATG